jgi:hypothetical protein
MVPYKYHPILVALFSPTLIPNLFEKKARTDGNCNDHYAGNPIHIWTFVNVNF